jgi:Tfp pilus assembly protein PilV
MAFKSKTQKISKMNGKNGFTLIEALISLFVFMVITTILMNIYIVTIRSERIAYTVLRDGNIVQNTLESMARSIRMGADFELFDGNTRLDFDTDEEKIPFKTSYKYNKETKKLQRARVLGRDGYINIIPDNIDIEGFEFRIDDRGQVSVLIKLSIVSSIYNNQYKTLIQTVVTPRALTAKK